MRHYLHNHWQLIVIIALLIYIIANPPVVVAEIVHATPDVPACLAIAKAGNLTVYRCQPDDGPPFKLNSYGFMLDED